MPVIKGTRIKPALPQMPAAPVKTVYVLRIHQMRPPYRLGQRIPIARYPYQMDMIAHKAVTNDSQPITARLLLKNLKIHRAIIINKEHILPIVTALRNVMGNINDNCPC
jgi:hypothetical protein